MKKKLSTKIIALMMIVGLGLSAVSCTEYVYDNDIVETQWDVRIFEIERHEWKWNNKEEQWEVIRNFPQLNDNVYEIGAPLSYILLGQQGKDEVQIPLPYVNTLHLGVDDDGYDIIITETISCEYQIDRGRTIKFIIKASDLYPDEEAPSQYNFKVVLIW